MKNYITYAKTTDAVLPFEAPHRHIAYLAASESIVLLENDGTLPLNIGKIALYGAGAKYTIKGGTGSGEVNERHSVSIFEGLEDAGFEITTKRWLNDYHAAYTHEIQKIEDEVKAAFKKLDFSTYMGLFMKTAIYPYGRKITLQDVKESQTDTCIYVIARQSGEGCERKLESNDFMLSDIEKENIRFCTEHYAKTIVVLNTGASFDTGFTEEIPGINALIYFCQQGCAGGSAFADIITGKVTPSGKLTDTWIRSYDDVPFGKEYSYLNGNLEDEDYLEDIYVGYRYYDTFHVPVRYPFGYGLSYTTFDTHFHSVKRDEDMITVKARVRNTGSTYSGKEVVQLYASCPQGQMTKEYQRLCAFSKTKSLAPGEEDIVVLTFPASYLASYDEEVSAYILEKGDYLLRMGNSSKNTRICTVLTLPQNICLSSHANICPVKKELDVLICDITEPENTNLSGIPHIELWPDDVVTTIYGYQKLPICPYEKIKAKLKTLTVDERIELVIGAGLLDMLMNSSYVKVPGVAGNTTSKLLHKGIVNIALSDGPAGIRFQRRSTITKNGTAKMVDMQFDMMKHFPNFIKRILCGNPDKEQVYYQYATAFPVATAMAQTWNTDLLEAMGNAVGEEMETYGITFWLAPGMNIHRNPLCGRNFEYYSEDPLLSGKMAAAITRGVQHHPGHYVTLKHFCGNNQEENRNQVSSNMTERALREIYLRGFEIAVREGHAKGLMSSYNKLNGVYTSNSHDLLTKVLRQEWGFDGLVMTDWTATGSGRSNPYKCISSGNDLIMPGSSYDKKMIKQAIKAGILSRKDLNRCAANVLTAIENGRQDIRSTATAIENISL